MNGELKRRGKLPSEFSEKIVVYGCGGHARSIVNAVLEIDENATVIMVDECAKYNEIIMGCRVVKEYVLSVNENYIVAIGDNKKRKEVCEKLRKQSNCANRITIISPYAVIGNGAKIARGAFVGAKAYIGPLAEIGENTIINTASIVEHEVIIGDYTHIAPNVTICGRTVIGNNVFCGAGSIIVDGVSICDNVILGAGTVVKESISEAGTYVGVPARKIR